MSVQALSSGSLTTNPQRSVIASSPRNGRTSAPVNNMLGPTPVNYASSHDGRPRTPTLTTSSTSPVARAASFTNRRPRAISREEASMRSWSDLSSSSMNSPTSRFGFVLSPATPRSLSSHKSLSLTSIAVAKAQSRCAQRINDAMVYLDGPQVYACAQCRTHLSSHDDIISKSFHGRHGKIGFD
jgi:hypothetical protein